MTTTQQAKKSKRRRDTCIPHNSRNCIKCTYCRHGFYDGVGCIICDTDGAAESQGIFPTKKELLLNTIGTYCEIQGDHNKLVEEIVALFKIPRGSVEYQKFTGNYSHQ